MAGTQYRSRYELLILDPLALGDNNVKSKGMGFEHHPFAVLAVARLNTLIVEVTFMNLWMVGEVHPRVITHNEFIWPPREFWAESDYMWVKHLTCHGHKTRGSDLCVNTLFPLYNILQHI